MAAACRSMDPASSMMGVEPESAFLPMPEGEGPRTSGAGIAFASLKQRRISHASNSPRIGSPAAAIASQGSGASYFGSALSKLGSSVASYVTGGTHNVSGGGSATGGAAAPVKEQ